MSPDAIAALLEASETPDPAAEAAGHPKRFCFVEGTHVATLRGEIPVQQLLVGDHIRSKKGSFHVVSEIATYRFDDLAPEAQARIAVGRILRGAVDEGLPRRDLYVSEGQEFELSRRLEISHAVRMTVRKTGEALLGMRFVVFVCHGLPMIRAEGIWTTATPMERAFPAAPPQAQPEAGETEPQARAPAPRSVTRLMEAAALTPERITRRPRTRMLSRPASAPASHRTETGTPAP